METDPNKQNQETPGKNKDKVFGDPIYSPGEDIYNREEKESYNENALPGQKKKKIPPQDKTLDVPGEDLDDADEIIGEEDEENNYYSLGGDDHNDLDEDNPE